MEFLSRSWSVSALEVSKALAPPRLTLSKNPFTGNALVTAVSGSGGVILEDLTGEFEEATTLSGNPFSFASSATSQMVMERIMSQSVSLVEQSRADRFYFLFFGAEHVWTNDGICSLFVLCLGEMEIDCCNFAYLCFLFF